MWPATPGPPSRTLSTWPDPRPQHSAAIPSCRYDALSFMSFVTARGLISLFKKGVGHKIFCLLWFKLTLVLWNIYVFDGDFVEKFERIFFFCNAESVQNDFLPLSYLQYSLDAGEPGGSVPAYLPLLHPHPVHQGSQQGASRCHGIQDSSGLTGAGKYPPETHFCCKAVLRILVKLIRICLQDFATSDPNPTGT